MSDSSGLDASVPPRRAAWRTWLLPAGLLASLALNVFLGSTLVGRYAHDRARGDASIIGFREFSDTLPGPVREKVRESFRARRGELRQERSDLRHARDRVMQAMAADPYDEAAVRSAFESLRQASTDLSRVAQEAVIEAAANLPPELRRDLAEQRPRRPRPRSTETQPAARP